MAFVKIEDEFSKEKSEVKETYVPGLGMVEEEDEEPQIKKEEHKEKKVVDGNDILKSNSNKPIINLPCKGKLISKFAIEVGDILQKTKTIFFRPDSMDLVEVGTYKDNTGIYIDNGFVSVRPSRFITLVEKYGIPGYDEWHPKTKEAEGYWGFSEKSMTSELSKTVLEAPHFQDRMPNIERIFTVPIPIMYKKELSFPKQGFDIRFNSWLPFDSPEIEDENMPIKEAIELINKTYSEFCFKDEQDKSNAIAAAITPFCRGLFSSFCVRTPPGFYKGNRPRVGKDCAAGVTGIIYEGYSLSEPPISSGESSNNNNEELRKKLMSAFMAGRRRMHFANNKGKINNSVFEAVITENVWSDRLLGGNKIGKFNNEIDYSLSGNTNVTLTPDLEDRCLFINLFLDIENANDRTFKNPDLHKWVLGNRGKLLSAFYSLVKNWVKMGGKKGSVPFASFQEWSNIIGGIMESAGYKNPCNRDVNTQLSVNDPEKDYMKQIYEYFYDKYPNKIINRKTMIDIIKDTHTDLDVFPYLDFDKKSGQMKLASIINSFNGRILSKIRFRIVDLNIRGPRQEIIFEKDGNLGNLGNLKTHVFLEANNNYIDIRGKVAKVAKVTNNISNIDKKDIKVEESDTKPKNKEINIVKEEILIMKNKKEDENDNTSTT